MFVDIFYIFGLIRDRLSGEFIDDYGINLYL